MAFNSIFFFLTFLSFLGVYLALKSRWPVAARSLTLLYSYFFYGMWNPAFLLLIGASTLIDYSAGLGMSRYPLHKLALLRLSLFTNLGLLGVFKYFNFFASSAAWLVELTGFPVTPPALTVLLPVGISFYTFQTLSYTIDVYRGDLEPRRSLLDFAFYVAYFPQLVAGPIVRARDFLVQVEANPFPSAAKFAHGWTLVVLGLFMKTVIADNAAPRVDHLFSTWQQNSALENWAASMLFGVQIHGDFSGYSLVAIGIALIMGYDIPRNFNSPYGALGFSDFWRRWHISLSTWLRDYLYISLGGNRRGMRSTYINLMITMLLGGLWHGASFMFIVWGGIHGVYLCVERALRDFVQKRPIPARYAALLYPIGIVLTYLTVSITWIPFRAESTDQCIGMLKGLAFAPFVRYDNMVFDFGFAGAVFMGHTIWRNRSFADQLERSGALRYFVLTIMLLSLWFLAGERSEFIYFQF